MPQIDKKYRVNAGEFIHPIVIKRLQAGEPNSMGIVEEEWLTVMETRAKVVNSTGKEKLENGITEYEKIVKKFYFRTNRAIKVKANDRIFYDDEIFNIISSYDYDDKGVLSLIIANKTD